MNELLVIGFQETHRAREVLDELLELRLAWAVDLDVEDAVAVYRTRSGRLHVDSTMHPTKRQGATLGAVIGGLLGALLATPFTVAVSAVAAAAQGSVAAVTLGTVGAAIGGENASEEKENVGLSAEFVRQVAGVLAPGQSALFLVAEAANPERVATHFRGYGGTILRTTVPPAEAKRVQAILSAEPVRSASSA